MIKKFLAAAALSAVAMAAQATLTGGVAANQNPSSFIDLATANVVGGARYTTDQNPAAAIPTNTAPPISTVGTYIAAGPSNLNNGGGDATLSFAGGTSFVSFLWGSPDIYNTLTVTTNVTSYTFGSADFPTIVFNGNQSFASYIGFNTTGGEFINSLKFSSPGTNAFEVANVSITTPVPEPETYALLLAGLGVVGFMARRRKSV